jgi:D-arginine dehydrogenase
MNTDVIIAGGGVLGVTLGYHLTQRGYRAVLLEREILTATHASGRNAGMIRQLYRHPQLTEWTTRSINGWPEDVRNSCFRRTGSLIAGRRAPEHSPGLFQNCVIRGDNGVSLSAVRTDTDGLLDSPNYVQAILARTDKTRLQLRLAEAVESVERCSSHFRVQTVRGNTYEAPWFVNAAGAWIAEVLERGLKQQMIPAEPFARHLFVVNGWPEDFMPVPGCGFYWNEEESWYMRLWGPERRLVSICDRIPANPATFVPDPLREERLAAALLKALPGIAADLQIERSWHCFRTYTEDQLPVWGEDPECPGLFWLAAFGGFGMSTSYAATEDAAAWIVQDPDRRSFPDFSPKRLSSGPANGTADVRTGRA